MNLTKSNSCYNINDNNVDDLKIIYKKELNNCQEKIKHELNINLDNLDIKYNTFKKNIESKLKDFDTINIERFKMVDKKLSDCQGERS